MNIIMAVLGGLLYRWRGMAHPLKRFTPRPVTQALFALPYAILVFGKNRFLALPVLVLATLAVLTGHGSFMDLGHWAEPTEPERLEFLIAWARDDLSPYWYDALGLAITGLVVTIPAGLITLNPLLALSGALKAPAYMIGWKLFDGEKATETGELLTGVFLWATLSIWLLLTKNNQHPGRKSLTR